MIDNAMDEWWEDVLTHVIRLRVIVTDKEKAKASLAAALKGFSGMSHDFAPGIRVISLLPEDKGESPSFMSNLGRDD
jgi:hypothetical protein